MTTVYTHVKPPGKREKDGDDRPERDGERGMGSCFPNPSRGSEMPDAASATLSVSHQADLLSLRLFILTPSRVIYTASVCVHARAITWRRKTERIVIQEIPASISNRVYDDDSVITASIVKWSGFIRARDERGVALCVICVLRKGNFGDGGV